MSTEPIICTDEAHLAELRARAEKYADDKFERNRAEFNIKLIEARLARQRGEGVEKKRRNFGYAIKSNRG
jgi:hypothetical protein